MLTLRVNYKINILGNINMTYFIFIEKLLVNCCILQLLGPILPFSLNINISKNLRQNLDVALRIVSYIKNDSGVGLLSF